MRRAVYIPTFVPVRRSSSTGANIGGERTKLQVAHTKLSHSRAFIVRAYLLLPPTEN
mgnify:FL=1